jgi:hypothetical protein
MAESSVEENIGAQRRTSRMKGENKSLEYS